MRDPVTIRTADGYEVQLLDDPTGGPLIYWCWNMREPYFATFGEPRADADPNEPQCPACGYVDPLHTFLFKIGRPREVGL